MYDEIRREYETARDRVRAHRRLYSRVSRRKQILKKLFQARPSFQKNSFHRQAAGFSLHADVPKESRAEFIVERWIDAKGIGTWGLKQPIKPSMVLGREPALVSGVSCALFIIVP